MTSTSPVAIVTGAVKTAIGQVGRGLYGVACSGGADSIALADAAIEVAGAAHVVVIALDHGLRAGSAEVTAAVAAWARSRGAAAVTRRLDVPRRASLEAAARDARYAALDAIADELGLAAIFIGHTARDQAETVLMRVLRGTGPAGLAGIPARRGRFIRPLLALERATIDAYVAARALPTWDDPMNADPDLARVRIRREVLPALRRENPQLDAALVRLAASTTEWLAVIDAIAAPLAALPLSCATLAAQPPAIRKRVLAIALDRAGIDHDAAHLAALDRLVTAPARGQVALDLPGARIVRDYDALRMVTNTPRPPAAALEAPEGYQLRAWRPGDRMRPKRLKGRSRKLSDLYIDAKVPRDARVHARVLVRTNDDVIVWAEFVGLAFDESLPNWPGTFE